MMLSNHLILCFHLLLLFSIFPSIRVFSSESALHTRWPKYWASASVLPMSIQGWFPSGDGSVQLPPASLSWWVSLFPLILPQVISWLLPWLATVGIHPLEHSENHGSWSFTYKKWGKKKKTFRVQKPTGPPWFQLQVMIYLRKLVQYTVPRINLNIKVLLLSHILLFETLWTVAHQTPLSMEFSRQEYWNRLPFSSSGDLPYPGLKPGSSALQADSLPSEPPGKSNLNIAYELWVIMMCQCRFICCSITKCLTLCDPVDCSMPGFPVLHHPPEFAQSHVQRVSDASNHLSSVTPCHPLLLLPSVFPSIRLFSNELALCIRWPKYWSFSFSNSPSNEYSGLISFRTGLIFLLFEGLSGVFSNTTVWKHQFFGTQSSLWSNSHIWTWLLEIP